MNNLPSYHTDMNRNRFMKAVFVAIFVLSFTTSLAIADEPAQDEDVAELKARIQQLEEALKKRKQQVAQLEELAKRTPAIVAPVAPKAGIALPTALKTVGPKPIASRDFVFTKDGQLQVVPADGMLVQPVPTHPVPTRPSTSYVAPVPESWSPRQINGLRYYIVPCAPTTITPVFATPAFSTSFSYSRSYRFPSLLAPYSSGHVFRYHSHRVVAPRIPTFSYRSHYHSTHHHHDHFHH